MDSIRLGGIFQDKEEEEEVQVQVAVQEALLPDPVVEAPATPQPEEPAEVAAATSQNVNEDNGKVQKNEKKQGVTRSGIYFEIDYDNDY